MAPLCRDMLVGLLIRVVHVVHFAIVRLGLVVKFLLMLRDGLASLPRADESVRRQLDADAAATSWAIQHQRLRAVDPEAAARIAPTDRQRIQRALECARDRT